MVEEVKAEGRKSWIEAIEKDSIGSWTHVSQLSYYNGPIVKIMVLLQFHHHF